MTEPGVILAGLLVVFFLLMLTRTQTIRCTCSSKHCRCGSGCLCCKREGFNRAKMNRPGLRKMWELRSPADYPHGRFIEYGMPGAILSNVYKW